MDCQCSNTLNCAEHALLLLPCCRKTCRSYGKEHFIPICFHSKDHNRNFSKLWNLRFLNPCFFFWVPVFKWDIFPFFPFPTTFFWSSNAGFFSGFQRAKDFGVCFVHKPPKDMATQSYWHPFGRKHVRTQTCRSPVGAWVVLQLFSTNFLV